jgi:hypothetical protein
MRYTDVWNDLTEKMGYCRYGRSVCDLQTQYMESVWWILKQSIIKI